MRNPENPVTVTPMPVFLNRLKFQTATGGLDNFRNLRLECFFFVFVPPLDLKIQYEFIEYMESVGMRDLSDVFRAAIWLRQHEIRFRLRFWWDRHESLRYNLTMLKHFLTVKRIMVFHDGQVMSYRLDAEPDAAGRT